MDEQVIALAKEVAAIPWGEARTVEEVLAKNVGTCTGKHLLLQSRLDELGITYRPVVCTFRWHDQGLTLPDHLQRILDEHDWVHGHNFVQVQSGAGGWIDLDVTWDPALEQYGFQSLPSGWDGQTDFVGLRSIVERWDDVSIANKKTELIAALTDEQKEAREEFLTGLIEWIASVR